MKVSSQHHKVIALKKAIYCYLAILAALFSIIGVLAYFIESNNVFWQILYILFWILFGVAGLYSIKYGFLSVNSSMHPPPNTWVISSWNMYQGKKAIWHGKGLIILGVVIFFQAAYLVFNITSQLMW
jgi:hypothetical protein